VIPISGSVDAQFATSGDLSIIAKIPASSAQFQFGTSGSIAKRVEIGGAAEMTFNTTGTDKLVRRELLVGAGIEAQVYDLADPNGPMLGVLKYVDLKFEDVLSDTGSATITLDYAWIGHPWLLKDNVVRFLVEGVERFAVFIEDVIEVPVEESEKKSIQIIGRGTGKVLEWAAVAPANFPVSTTTKRIWNGTSRGQALYDLFEEFKARGVTPYATRDSWDRISSSNGTPWSTLVDLEFDAGGSYLELLQSWVDFGLEWHMDSRFGLALAPEISRDLTGIVRLYPANTITGITNTTTRRELRTRLLTEDGSGNVVAISDPTALDEWGVREQYVVFSDALGEATSTASGYALMNLIKNQIIERAVKINPLVPGRRPFVDFDIGDLVGVVIGGTAFAFRVLAIAMAVDENGKLTAEITLDYLLEAQRKRRAALLNASSAGGGTSSGPQMVYKVDGPFRASPSSSIVCTMSIEAFTPTYGKMGYTLRGVASDPMTVTVDFIYDGITVKSFPQQIPAPGLDTVEISWLWLGIPQGSKQVWLRVTTSTGTFDVGAQDAQLWVEAKGIAGATLNGGNITVDDIVPGGKATDLVTVTESVEFSDLGLPFTEIGETVTTTPYPSVTDTVGPDLDGAIVLGVDAPVLLAAEDGYTTATPSFTSTGTETITGNVAGVANGAFYRFDLPSGIDLSGVVITDAYLTLVSTLTSAVLARTRLTLADEADPAAPTSRADFTGRARVGGSASWESAMTSGTTYRTPSLATMVQSLVDSYGDLEAILVFHENDASPTNGQMRFRSKENPLSTPPVLTIQYIIP